MGIKKVHIFVTLVILAWPFVCILGCMKPFRRTYLDIYNGLI